MIASTIVARNYLAQAEVVASSFLAHHPDAEFVTLLLDGTDADRAAVRGAGTICVPDDLGLDDGEWQQMAAVYTVIELATALKAALLRHLLTRPGRAPAAVCYLDPDIMVYRPFPEVFAEAERAGIALTPHVLHPLPRDGLEPDERMLMHAGLFNLGFIGVGSSALAFLDWWHERLRIDSVIDLTNALFTDQRWIDWVPSLFGCAVLRDPGLNVAYWNVHERPLTRGEDGTIAAAGAPLRFFHFSGFDPDQPWRLSVHTAERPRLGLPDLPIVAELCADYADALRAAGFGIRHASPYGWATTPDGITLTPLVRRAYRAAVQAAQRGGPAAPASPFSGDGGAAFTQWLTVPTAVASGLGLSVWQRELWRMRADLRTAFPDPEGIDAEAFAAWLRDDPGAHAAREEIGVPVAAAAPPDRLRAPAPHGWNVVGYFSAELGVGEAGRRMSLAIEAAGLPTEWVAVSADASRAGHPLRRRLAGRLEYQDTLYCVNADQLAGVMARVGDRPGTGGRRVGLWFWEVERFPTGSLPAFDLVDEVWCASTYTTEILAAVAPIPVRTVPLPVWAPSSPTPFGREQLDLPDGFTFLFSYDFNSVFGRKNPLGVIDAYTRAFGPDDGATLVLKSINGLNHRFELDRVRHAASARADIEVRDEYLDAPRVQALVEHCDCFVSLHRAEGFGLGMAAAMAAGRPVIATGYSGNLDFMDADSARLVPYELVPVGAGMGPYPAEALWAEPDLDAAAAHMRALFDDPAGGRELGARGRAHVLDRQSIERSSAAIAERLLTGAPA